MKISIAVAVAACLAVTPSLSVPQPKQAAQEPLVEQVRAAIAKGKSYLKNKQRENGSWESETIFAGHRGGQTALALLALLNSGVKPNEEYIRKGLDFLRTVEKPGTYVRSLQTMVFVEANQGEDNERIKQNIKHLLETAVYEAGRLQGWGYDGAPGPAQRADNSNTQYALLAIWVAKQSGVAIKKELWEKVREFYTRTQFKSGSWAYDNTVNLPPESFTMTVAGLCGMFMTQIEMSAGREDRKPEEICGYYPEDTVIKKGLSWVSSSSPGPDRFTLKIPNKIFYSLYGIERLGRLSGQRFLGAHDWYREGCTWLVSRQNKSDGSWAESSGYDAYPTLSTSFALLFLSKGRTPVLISKLAHGPEPRQSNDQDWNRRRNELRHLVDFVSDKVFKKLPLAWQTVDMRRQSVTTPQQMQELTADLLQSPILYFTGHTSPAKRFKDVEKEVLKQYVENGGFILGAACCGSREFSDGFEQLCRELWPQSELVDLELDHMVWNMPFEVKPGSFGLKGISMGCKTVAILATENICGYWEINRRKDIGQTAFHLGANIVAYATGLEPPKDRLALGNVGLTPKSNLDTPPRGYFQVGQLIGKVGEEADWRPAPLAMSKLVEHLRDTAGLDAVIKTNMVPIDHKDLTKFKFLYMHGRMDFKFSSEQLERLRFNLSKGGALLFADACCGKEPFDKAFRRFIGDLFPKGSLPEGENAVLVPIPQDDLLFSQDLNSTALTDTNISCRTERGAAPHPMRPALEGVKIGKRWVVIYSKYDIGCALEKHQSADCIGYNYDSAMKLARAAVLYQFRVP